MKKCKYCGMELNRFDDYFNREHVNCCRFASPMVRYINSGIEQKDYPKKK